MLNGFVGVQAVDMQKIDSIVGEIAARLIESAAQELGESSEVGFVESVQLLKHFITVEPGVLVSAPGIDCKGARWQAVPEQWPERTRNRSSRRACPARRTSPGGIFYLDQLEGNGKMARPRSRRYLAGWLPKQLVAEFERRERGRFRSATRIRSWNCGVSSTAGLDQVARIRGVSKDYLILLLFHVARTLITSSYTDHACLLRRRLITYEL